MNNYEFSFQKLDIWKRSIELSVRIYQLTSTFPDTEKFGITNQLRRATNSIGANIAEGTGRKSEKDKARFFQIAFSSLLEVVHFLELSVKLEFIAKEEISEISAIIAEVSNKLNALHKKILEQD
jgi:four helix bundle protein